MDFALSDEQQRIREAIAKLCTRFPDDYWLKRDQEGGFPADFHQAAARDGWLGIAMPEEFGGAGLGMTTAVLLAGVAVVLLFGLATAGQSLEDLSERRGLDVAAPTSPDVP